MAGTNNAPAAIKTPRSKRSASGRAVAGASSHDSGHVTIHDVARAVLEEQGFENRMLKAYIRDWPAEG